MAERFLRLSEAERRDALGVAAEASGRPAHLLEKDVWVVWALQALFEAPFAPRATMLRPSFRGEADSSFRW